MLWQTVDTEEWTVEVVLHTVSPSSFSVPDTDIIQVPLKPCVVTRGEEDVQEGCI